MKTFVISDSKDGLRRMVIVVAEDKNGRRRSFTRHERRSSLAGEWTYNPPPVALSPRPAGKNFLYPDR